MSGLRIAEDQGCAIVCDQCGEWMEWVEWKSGVGQVNGWHCEVCKMLVFPNKGIAP